MVFKYFKTVLNWSGGKDSSIALHQILQDPEYSVERLLTSVNTAHDRISMHGVRKELLLQQTKSIGIPLSTLDLPEQPGMQEYNDLFGRRMETLREEGFTHAVFGDIFLEDLRAYRENQLKKADFKGVFPIWKRDTRKLVEQFIADGFKAITVCVKAEKLGREFAGRIIDHDFIRDLPDDVDPCGENGEFHTFVFDGPIFSVPIPYKKGEIVYRAYQAPKEEEDACGLSNETDPSKMGFWFCDLLGQDA